MKPVTLSETVDREYWIKTYEFDGMAGEGRAVALMPNGDIVVVGTVKGKRNHSSNGFVARFDKDGNVKWAQIIGGSKDDEFNDVKVALDGDIIVVGQTESFGSSGKDAWVLRLDGKGDIIWQKTYGGKNSDWAEVVAIAPNGDIIVAGSTYSFNKGYHTDVWILRFDSAGNVKWQKSYGGDRDDEARAVVVTPDDDILVICYTESFNSYAWVIMLDSNGNIKWQKVYDTGDITEFTSGVVTPDNEFILVGNSGGFLFFRIDAEGNIKCGKSIQEYDINGCTASLAPNRDLIIAGRIMNFDFDIEGIQILRFDEIGNIRWQKTCGRDYSSDVQRVIIDRDNNIILVGTWEIELDDDFVWSLKQGTPWLLCLPPNGKIPNCKLCRDSNTQVMDITATVLETNCRVTNVDASMGFKLMESRAIVRRVTPKVEVLCEQKGGLKMSSFPSELLDKYEPLEFLGSGGSSNVFKVKRKKDGKIVAVKVLTLRGDDLEKFMRGISKWPQLVHPNIVRLYDAGSLPIPYLEMEYTEGTEFKGRLVRTLEELPKPVETETAVKIILDIAEGLKYAHSRGVIHTDLKPSNILLKGNSTPKISDWVDMQIFKITQTSSFTPLYTSPEHLGHDGGSVDRRTDIWQLGLIFYELVTGKLPFESHSITELVSRILNEDPAKPSRINPQAEPFDKIIMKCLAKRKEDRYQSVDEFLNDLFKVTGKTTSIGSRFESLKSRILGEPRRLSANRALSDEISHGIGDTHRETHASSYSTNEVPGFPPALLERYEPLEFLGEGGFAKVFKVKRKSDGKIVALKIPRIDERTSSLFIKEVAAWYNLNHENIVRLYRADILPVPYLEMEFVEGANVGGKLVRDLEEYSKPVDEKTALKLITGIAHGLAHTHSKGIYHLDLKPLNVLLKADMTPKITDWGLAKISARSSLSRHYGYSPLYAAPEQLDEEALGEPDHRTDVYQLGLILYELLTGELPYRATSPGALVGKILSAKPTPISELKPGLKRFDGVFEKLLAKRKEERYQSVEEFLSALESLTELEREKEELRKTSLAMKKSRSREEFERLRIESIHKTVKIAILSAKLNDKAELLAALDDLKFYTRENLDDLLSAIEQVELLLKGGIPIGPEVEERLRALVLRIKEEALR